ncbi:MAG: sugar ABC transporter permease [Candidatus Moranbacteria bacterium]|nr:sugar ABC transporter permease [Candidatus Moranbacteria bacterium]
MFKKQKKAQITKKMTSRSKVLYMMASVPMLLLFVFNYLPMLGVIIAFKNYKYDQGIFGSSWVGLKNFEYFFRSSDFWRIITNTLWFNAIFIVTGILTAVTIAVLLYELTNRFLTKLFQTIMITPHFISWVVAGYMAYAIMQPQNGYLNNALITLGMEPVDWYTTPNAWTTILATANIWKNVGYGNAERRHSEHTRRKWRSNRRRCIGR